MKKNILLLVALLLMCVWGCKENVLEPYLNDSSVPGAVSVKSIENISGGAIIKYDIPNDEDLLYVKAVFDLQGKESESRASFYNNEVRIEGFGDTLVHKVQLISVDKSENESEPVAVEIKPLKSAVMSTAETVSIVSSWGGAKFSWVNENEGALTINLLAEDSLGSMVPFNTIYSDDVEGKGYIRGFDPEPRRFAAVIRDRWMNYSDTIWPEGGQMIMPRLEQKVDKSKFKKLILKGDQSWDQWGGHYENAYDGNIKSIAHTKGGTGWPHIFSVDLGAKVKLSRYHMWQRQDSPKGQAYAHGNVRRWAVYGTADTPDEDGSLDNWTKLMDCTIEKPSGLPVEENTDEDLQLLKKGHEFEVPENAPEIRYLRFVILETWTNSNFTYLAEFNLYGAITELE
ncbi:DUF4959 domain-containing protein [Puteibacter caeruleilacunae]|nr:DUF4959 domain-containing protein [Puteibacter caeruleilacunae]